MPSWLRVAPDFLAGVRVADVIDVAIVSALVYAALSWVRRARSRFVVGGFAALIALYLAARLLEMYLTLFLFQVGVTVAAVALVVIFQEDIRRAFERIATSRLLGARRIPAASAALVDVLVETAGTLAHKRFGALIVLRGKEPLERHTSGGFALDGRPTEPLLVSIFDPGSAGHDGALVIESGLVSKFAVHLPLSTELRLGETPERTHLGTRHAAAVGLSERSDALVVVVSEERGTISVARAGKLEVVDSAAELRARLLDFLREVAPERDVSWYRRAFTRDLGAKALSVAIAVVAWLVVFGYQSDAVARSYDAAIVYRNVPSEWLLEEPRPPSTRLTLSGSSRAFDELDPTALTVSLNLTDIRPGAQVVRIADADVNAPRDLLVYRVEPRPVLIVAHRALRRALPVRPTTRGSLPDGLRVSRISATPAKVELWVKRSGSTPSDIATEPIELAEITSTTTVTRALRAPEDSRLASGEPDEVRVLVEVVR